MNNILWVDDEIELLKPHVIYLQSKGYNLTTAKSGDEALEIIENNSFNLIFLDENMPGLSGLETLNIIKDKFNNIPVVMITKSEEESIMEEAIGSKISDYLIKPVNPSQILLSIKKNLDSSRLVDEKIARGYQQEFRNISLQLSSNLSFEEWCDVYKKIIGMPISYFTDKKKGDVISRITADVLEIQHSFLSILELIVREPLTIFFTITAMFLISFKLTAFVLIFIPLSGFIISLIGRSLKATSTLVQNEQAEFLSITEETLNGLKIIKGFVSEFFFIEKNIKY